GMTKTAPAKAETLLADVGPCMPIIKATMNNLNMLSLSAPRNWVTFSQVKDFDNFNCVSLIYNLWLHYTFIRDKR
ncbi:MAG: hypothetical protein ACYTFE_04185, partial [Planctomycetota bacterium]